MTGIEEYPFFKVKNFEKFQHYKDRNPTWIKLYSDILEDDLRGGKNFATLPDHSKWHLIGIWILASRTGNRLPTNCRVLKKHLHCTTNVDLRVLFNYGFILPIVESENASTSVSELTKTAIPEKERYKQENIIREEKPLTLVHPQKNAAEPLVEKVSKTPKKITPKKFPEAFEKVWKLYPHPVGKKNAFRHFSTSVDPADTSKIETALQIYKNYVDGVRAQGRNLEWQNGSTWFNNWQDWLTIRDAAPVDTRTLREKLEAKMAAGVNSD